MVESEVGCQLFDYSEVYNRACVFFRTTGGKILLFILNNNSKE